MKIVFIGKESKYGGSVYENKVREVVSEHFNVETKNLFSKKDFLFKAWRISKRKDVDVVIRNLDASLFLNKKPVKNIVVVHHIDYSFAPFLIKFVFFFLTPLILKNLRKSDAIVVVSNYWKNYFEKKGYKNIHLIYNAFDIEEFNISEEEVLEFKKKYKLEGKPIIYLGNCQKAKGVVESYNALKDLDAHLVTSGNKAVKIPAINLNLSYKEYLILLKASSIVVTMSKFKEGWNRTAHEAMLSKTPVIGSGKGGMQELLEGGKQIICHDFHCLEEKVKYLLNNFEVGKEMGENGYNFTKDFTIDRFKKDWLNLINKLK